jgi:hypothetical protein
MYSIKFVTIVDRPTLPIFGGIWNIQDKGKLKGMNSVIYRTHSLNILKFDVSNFSLIFCVKSLWFDLKFNSIIK